MGNSDDLKRFHDLVEFSPDGIVVHSEGKIVFINPAGAKLIGADDPDELIGRNPLDFVHPDYHEVVKERIMHAIKEGRPTDLIHEKFIRLDGELIDVEVIAMPITFDGKPSVQVVVRDITQRIKAEGDVREQKDQLNTILSSTPYLMVLKDRNGVYKAVNPAFTKFLGKSEGEIIGKTDFDLFPKDEANIYTTDDNRIMDTKTPQVQDEEVTGEGGKKWLQVAKDPILDDNGESIGILCSVRDITERKLAEEKLEKTNKELAKFNKLATGRELKMIELKKEINDLLQERGHQKKYSW